MRWRAQLQTFHTIRIPDMSTYDIEVNKSSTQTQTEIATQQNSCRQIGVSKPVVLSLILYKGLTISNNFPQFSYKMGLKHVDLYFIFLAPPPPPRLPSDPLPGLDPLLMPSQRAIFLLQRNFKTNSFWAMKKDQRNVQNNVQKHL